MKIFDTESTKPEFLPAQAHWDDAGYDLRAAEELIINPGQRALVGTGCYLDLAAIEINSNEELDFVPFAMVCSRSGLANKHGVFVLNAPGIVDRSYTGEVKVILQNSGDEWFEIKKGDRIAQLVVNYSVHSRNWVKPSNEVTRGEAGFGSTGIKSIDPNGFYLFEREDNRPDHFFNDVECLIAAPAEFGPKLDYWLGELLNSEDFHSFPGCRLLTGTHCFYYSNKEELSNDLREIDLDYVVSPNGEIKNA